MRTEILETIPKPNYFKAEVCTCGMPNQVRVIVWFMGALVWTARMRMPDVPQYVDSVYKLFLRGHRSVEGMVA